LQKSRKCLLFEILMNKRQLYRILIAAGIYIAALFFRGYVQIALFLAAYLIVGYPVLREAAENILHGQIFDENFLMAIASLGAMIIGEYPEGVFVMLFAQVGELFETYAVNRSRGSIADMMAIKAQTATVWKNGAWQSIDPQEIQVGDELLLAPGALVAVDGIVTEGRSTLDTSALTGESWPVEIMVGSEIKSGCINLDGSIKMKATCKQEESTVAKVLELVENAASQKAKTERFITIFARYYTPCVVALAVALAVVPSLIFGNWSEWIHRGLIFLVVSCPCALVISVPLGFFSGIGVAAKEGILIKGSNYLEVLAKTQSIVTDKTGTLTKGFFAVEKVCVVKRDISEEELLKLAAKAEYYSTHPLASALKKCYMPTNDDQIGVCTEHSGLGVTTIVDGKEIRVGNGHLLEEIGLKAVVAAEKGTVVHVACDKEYLGYIVLNDSLKENAKDAMAQLSFARKVILSGDGEEAVSALAQEVGIREYYSRMLPEDKVEKFKEIRKETKGSTIYLGDGLNDAPVLALADVGIAMGGLGSEAAIEAADVVIMDDNLLRIPQAIAIAKKTAGIVRQNIVFALGIKGIVLILGALGLVNMWAAVFADVGVSIIAITNSMRLFLKRN